MVNIEISEKEIASAKTDLEILDVANEILRLQVAVIEKATEMIEIEMKRSGIMKEIAELEREIARLDLLPIELKSEQIKTEKDRLEVQLYESRELLAKLRTTAVKDEIDYVTGTMIPNEDVLTQSKEGLSDFRMKVKTDELDMNLTRIQDANQKRLDLADSVQENADADQIAQQTITQEELAALSAKSLEAWNRAESVIASAEKMAKANITTTLTHFVDKYTPPS